MRFYELVFGWTFEPWGPPGFYLIRCPGIPGALQQRRDKCGAGVNGCECTISVEDVDATTERIVANGGVILFRKTTIPGVGDLVKFCDTEGNILCAMRYNSR